MHACARGGRPKGAGAGIGRGEPPPPARKLGGNVGGGSSKTMGACRRLATTAVPCPVGVPDWSRGAGITERRGDELCEFPPKRSVPARLRKEGRQRASVASEFPLRVRVCVCAPVPVREMLDNSLIASYLCAYRLEIGLRYYCTACFSLPRFAKEAMNQCCNLSLLLCEVEPVTCPCALCNQSL